MPIRKDDGLWEVPRFAPDIGPNDLVGSSAVWRSNTSILFWFLEVLSVYGLLEYGIVDALGLYVRGDCGFPKKPPTTTRYLPSRIKQLLWLTFLLAWRTPIFFISIPWSLKKHWSYLTLYFSVYFTSKTSVGRHGLRGDWRTMSRSREVKRRHWPKSADIRAPESSSFKDF